MATSVDKAVESAQAYLSQLCEPGKMTPAEAIDFYEQVISDCESAIDGLKEDMENADGD